MDGAGLRPFVNTAEHTVLSCKLTKRYPWHLGFAAATHKSFKTARDSPRQIWSSKAWRPCATLTQPCGLAPRREEDVLLVYARDHLGASKRRRGTEWGDCIHCRVEASNDQHSQNAG